MLTCGSPQLIAAYRVLLRQSVPWHPPCALVRLILPVHVEHYFLRLLRVVFNKDCLLYCFFPVQFSRCVEVSLRFPFPTFRSLFPFVSGFSAFRFFSVFRSFKTIQKSFIRLSQILSSASLADYYCRYCVPFCRFLAACRSFRLPATCFQVVDLGYAPLFTDHFSLERR